MISALFSFLGGSVFRMIWGEVSHFFTQKQEHAQEMDRMRLQGELDAAQHARNLEALKLQSDLGIRTINVQSQADQAKVDADAFFNAVNAVGKPTGIKWIDAWNAAIRPLLASEAIFFMAIEVYNNGGKPTDFVMSVMAAVIGIYVADRSLKHRGK